jgi:UDP-N-acetylmuramyl tripeptide synthase
MSWLWDVDFAAGLSGHPSTHEAGDTPDAQQVKSGWLVTSGTRAADMAVRLQYDEIPTALVEPDLTDAVRQAVSHVKPGETVVVFSTYTAMWSLHRALLRMAGG